MTLKELLELKLVRDNISLRTFKTDSYNGLGEFTNQIDVNRIMGRSVTAEDLKANNVPDEWLNLEVIELWGYKANKMGIVLKEK